MLALEQATCDSTGPHGSRLSGRPVALGNKWASDLQPSEPFPGACELVFGTQHYPRRQVPRTPSAMMPEPRPVDESWAVISSRREP